MVLKLAWKNIWRSKKRSFVVIGSITVGVWALSFLFAFLASFNEAYLRNAIDHDYSHLQVHHPTYRIDPDVKAFISESEYLINALERSEDMAAYSTRTVLNGMAATGRSNQGVQIYGVDPEAEQRVTGLADLVLEGGYFDARRNPILLSRKLADKLKVNLRSKVILTFQDSARNIVSAAFRVNGIFESKSPRINSSVVYVREHDLKKVLEADLVHEVAVLLKDMEVLDQFTTDLSEQCSNSEVLAYHELAPEFNLLEQQSKLSKQILTSIIMLALLFGIVNTMLMAVLERTKELGMLRAVGMHKMKVFNMIIVETVLLSVLGGPLGIVFGYLMNWWFGSRGIDLSNYSESLQQYGYDAILYPAINVSEYPTLMVVVIITALVGSIYPALKAIQLNPVEAIRKI